MSEAAAKERALGDALASLDSVIVAYSGGVDSAYLAYIAHRTLGDRAVAVTADSPSYPERHRSIAIQVAHDFGLRHEIIHTTELERPEYRANPANRCYYCKHELYTHLSRIAAIAAGKHIVMVNVEADVLAGPLLAEEARKAGEVYSLPHGGQPALTAEMVDWARATGFHVVAAGKGTKYLPAYHDVTPDSVWQHYGLSAGEAQSAGMNPQMFNSFLDGTKSAIEMAAIANACGLDVPAEGLLFPPCGVDDLPHIMRPRSRGGVLERSGVVEVVSSLERDGRPVFRDLRWGVYVVLEAPNDYAADCFRQYGLKTDGSGRFAAMYKPYHLIGLELNISVLSTALRGEPTGQPHGFRGDVAAVAKRNLRAGEMLDGEGGYTVWGKLVPAAARLKAGG